VKESLADHPKNSWVNEHGTRILRKEQGEVAYTKLPPAPPEILRREVKRRNVIRTINVDRASAIGPIEPGSEVFGVIKGQFSLIEIIEHCLDYTGPAHLGISTWTAGGADIQHLHWLLEESRILSARWLLDASFPSRKWEYCEALVERFGAENLRFTSNHAKFVILASEPRPGKRPLFVSIRTSLNLNKCLRLEHFEITEGHDLFLYLRNVMKVAFRDAASFEECFHRPERAHRTIDTIDGPIEQGPPPVFYEPELKTKAVIKHEPVKGIQYGR
jgi:hypothetical protein